MTARLLTPSKITAWLSCEHALTLQHQLESGAIVPVAQRRSGRSPGCWPPRGLEHEAACLAAYRAQGLSVLEIPDRKRSETFAEWVERAGDPFAEGHDVIYQLPFARRGPWRGRLRARVVDEETGQVSYEPVDAKLARSEAKPGHVLQLCFYAEAIEALTGTLPAQMHLWLGSGEFETIRTNDVMPYWRHLRSGSNSLMSEAETTPIPCDHCEICDFASVCEDRWRAEDAVHLVAGVRTVDLAPLEAAASRRWRPWRSFPGSELEGVDPDRLLRMASQAELQRAARTGPGEAPPPFRLIEPPDGLPGSLGYEQLPEPDDGDVFLDFEGHPFWRPSGGLFFLFGWLCGDEAGDGAGAP
ncbi:MAG: hypothetical protein IPH38_09025 [Candidatus Microthrix sp.]|nr:PD-(D/E)XK nuclease family protein [Candidatus Microthrix sp.]MBK7019716.1 hypothetical protein [Candidatus Microthrix sp.]